MQRKDLLLDPVWQLESAEANLSSDIQALAYIQDDLETMKENEYKFAIKEIINRTEILFKSMIYNRDNMKNSIDAIYKEKQDK